MAKYVYDLGGVEDEGSAAKFSFYAGYVHIDLTDPQDPVAAGSETIGGYEYLTVNNQPYAHGSSKVLQTFWTGAKYELPSGLVSRPRTTALTKAVISRVRRRDRILALSSPPPTGLIPLTLGTPLPAIAPAI